VSIILQIIYTRQNTPFRDMLPWFFVSVGIFVVFWGILIFLRKLAIGKHRSSTDQNALKQIEQFHKEGILSDEQYKRARRSILGLDESTNRAGSERETEDDAHGCDKP